MVRTLHWAIKSMHTQARVCHESMGGCGGFVWQGSTFIVTSVWCQRRHRPPTVCKKRSLVWCWICYRLGSFFYIRVNVLLEFVRWGLQCFLVQHHQPSHQTNLHIHTSADWSQGSIYPFKTLQMYIYLPVFLNETPNVINLIYIIPHLISDDTISVHMKLV